MASLYKRFVLPRLLKCACSAPPIAKQRAKVVPNASGRVLELGIGMGLNLGLYDPAKVESVTGVDPARDLREIAMAAPRDPALKVSVEDGTAEALPFEDKSFDAAMAILTIHHWPDKEAGLREVRRVTRGPIVLLTFDPAQRPWLTDYLPELVRLDEEQMPTMADYERWLGPVQITPVRVPHDCSDGFLYAYWRRPSAYLDSRIRSGSSAFWTIGNIEAGLEELKTDLATGTWQRKYAELLTLDEYDAGYRLVVTQ